MQTLLFWYLLISRILEGRLQNRGKVYEFLNNIYSTLFNNSLYKNGLKTQ